jgi:hypothetical protein
MRKTNHWSRAISAFLQGFRLEAGLQRSMPWVSEGFDGGGVDFDEVRIVQSLFDIRPPLGEPFFKLCASQISQSNPNDFGRRTLDDDAIEEISVPR